MASAAVGCSHRSGSRLPWFSVLAAAVLLSCARLAVSLDVSKTNLTIDVKGVPVKPNIVVAQDGSGDYTTIQEAIYYVPPAYLPQHGTKIFIKAGWYNETIIIRPYMRYLSIIGDPEGGGSTVSCNRYSGMNNANGDMLSTLNTGCFVVFADDFTAVNVNFENASPRPPPNSYIYQAVALRVTANRTAVLNCTIRSFQDTLYAHKGWQYYKDCYIFGTVDFIFGQAKARFENCTMEMSSYGFASVTAQKRDFANDDNCFVITNSRIIGNRPIIARVSPSQAQTQTQRVLDFFPGHVC
eukprot:TRINITY_DN8614_c0_g1_i2.p1 TRINITY_DN8614_c0_g1~~TRINITY_DN8614_c0_g1_i2.p1  ORF type:complete len:297 (+),score=-3.05 TRINITY_DN8614_c0_g1_i2:724-1614(+)